MTNQYPQELLDDLQFDILTRYDNEEYWNPDIIEAYIHEHPDQFCPHDSEPLQTKMFDIDGTNLSEHLVCPLCGYGTPALL